MKKDSLRTSDFRSRVLFLGLILFTTAVCHARINVVTLPDRDTVQLTIYNSADLTLVKETRHLTFRKGINRLEFSWANTLIDPTSVEFRPLTHADEVELEDASFPPRVTNTLEWRIRSEFAGDVVVEIRYFTSGLSWSADYVAEASKDERLMDFSGAVRVTNNSGEDYENAQVRLVVGVIRLVEDIANLARSGKPGMPTTVAATLAPAASAPAPKAQALDLAYREMDRMEKLADARPREIVKEGVSEYFMYTVEGRDTIQTGWSKRMPSFKADGVPITSYYKFEKERFGDKVMRFYQFTNSVPSKLGKEPLPDGSVKAFRFVTDDWLYAFVGRTSVKYIPINEYVELALGDDQEVSVKPKMMDWQKTDVRFDQRGNINGWTIKETWQFEVQNSKDIPITVDIRRNFAGDWSLSTAAKYENVDANKVKFVVALKPREKQTFTFELATRHGTSRTR